MDTTYPDMLPDDPGWGHGFAEGSPGVRLHYVRPGRSAAEQPPVLLLHGWPGFWYDWRRVIPALAGAADVIALDLRGFGRSDRPDLPPAEGYTASHHAADVVGLLDHLDIAQAVLAGHDIGAVVAQAVAREYPGRVSGLVLCNPSYGGIGQRRFEPAAQREFWYQHLHNLPWAQDLIGHDRDTVRIYLAHFYDHWVGRKETVRPAELAAIVDEFARPGAVEASLAWYRARAAARAREAAADPATLRVHQPAWILWGEVDPVFPVAWSDRLAEYFADLRAFRRLPAVGHFVPFEAPEETVDAIRGALALEAAGRDPRARFDRPGTTMLC